MGADSSDWPHTEGYLATLSDGLHSHPRSVTKASVLVAFRAHVSLDALDEMPEDLAALVRYAPLPSQWLPTVHVNAVEMMLVDQLGGTKAFDDLAYQINCHYLRSPLYRAAFRVFSPQMLLRGAAFRWGHFHRGSTLELVRMNAKSARLHLSYPDNLFNDVLADEKAGAFRVALDLAGARDVSLKCEDRTPRDAFYKCTWTPVPR